MHASGPESTFRSDWGLNGMDESHLHDETAARTETPLRLMCPQCKSVTALCRDHRGRWIGSLSGLAAGGVAGAIGGAGIGVASGGVAMAATVPLGALLGALSSVAGFLIGDRIDKLRCRQCGREITMMDVIQAHNQALLAAASAAENSRAAAEAARRAATAAENVNSWARGSLETLRVVSLAAMAARAATDAAESSTAALAAHISATVEAAKRADLAAKAAETSAPE